MPQTKRQKRINAIEMKRNNIKQWEMWKKELTVSNVPNKEELLIKCAKKILTHQRDIENTLNKDNSIQI